MIFRQLVQLIEKRRKFSNDARDGIAVFTHMRGSLLLHLHQRFPTTISLDVA